MANSVNPDLQRERQKASFDKELLNHIIYEGAEKAKRRRYIISLVENDPDFDSPSFHLLSRDELYTEGVRRAALYIRKTAEYGLTNPEDMGWFISHVFPNEAAPLTLHYGMFIPALTSQGSEEQVQRWKPMADKYEILGTYAQTELGHGTFLRGLETTTTYDARTDEFVMNSPTLTSYKWWPGALGKTSNFAIVYATMFINGKSHGPHGFMVQLRDLKTHRLLPGVSCGDIGPKFGFNMIDNGYLKLDHVRIPRENLLMKNAKVLKDGTYVRSKHDKLNYGTMIFIRATMVYSTVADFIAEAATIATRYSCVRRQSELKPGQSEVQVLDFVTQQMRLFPQIAIAYAFKFAGYHMRDMYVAVTNEIRAGNTENLAELHGLSSGLKAYTTFQGSQAVEECRFCCGGHGYAHYSGLPQIYAMLVAGCTYEGENYVMYLQCARYLMKCVQQAIRGSKLPQTAAYLSGQFPLCLIDQDVDLKSLVNAFKHRAKRLIFGAAKNLSQLQSQGLDESDAWNQAHPYLVRAAEVHAKQFIMQAFADKVSTIADPRVARVMERLAVLYGLQDVIKQSGDFLEDGYLTAKQLHYCQQKFSRLLTELRPDAVTLVDAFDYSDRRLGTAIGTYDGNAYERILKYAQESPVNKHEVHPAIKKYMQGPSGPLAKL